MGWYSAWSEIELQAFRRLVMKYSFKLCYRESTCAIASEFQGLIWDLAPTCILFN
jgi:hypothetical protein